MRRVLMLTAAIVWVGAVAYAMVETWPHLPLDISPADPAVRALYERTRLDHLVRHGVIALAPLAGLLAVKWIFNKPRRASRQRDSILRE